MCTMTRKRLAWLVTCPMIAFAIIVVLIIASFRGGVRRDDAAVSAISLVDALQNFDEGFLPEYIRDMTLHPGMSVEDVRLTQVPLEERERLFPMFGINPVEGFCSGRGVQPCPSFDSVYLRMARGTILGLGRRGVEYITLTKRLEDAERLSVTRHHVRICLQALQAPHKRFVSETDLRGSAIKGKKLKWAHLLWQYDTYGVKVQFMPGRMFDHLLEDVGEENIDGMGKLVHLEIKPVEALTVERLAKPPVIKFHLPTEEETIEYFDYVDEVIDELGLERL